MFGEAYVGKTSLLFLVPAPFPRLDYLRGQRSAGHIFCLEEDPVDAIKGPYSEFLTEAGSAVALFDDQ